MNLEEVRTHCLKKKGKITEGFPFGEGALVFKVHGKMFLLAALDAHPVTLNLKCDPELAIELRERYEGVTPGYHMNKKFWNTVKMDGSIPRQELCRMIDHSYEMVVRGFGKTLSARLLGVQQAAKAKTKKRARQARD
jgi:predicted DNA-binding protein (MmcQ/YjbR family)